MSHFKCMAKPAKRRLRCPGCKGQMYRGANGNFCNNTSCSHYPGGKPLPASMLDKARVHA